MFICSFRPVSNCRRSRAAGATRIRRARRETLYTGIPARISVADPEADVLPREDANGADEAPEERVLDQILTLIFPHEPTEQILHNFSPLVIDRHRGHSLQHRSDTTLTLSAPGSPRGVVSSIL